MAGSMNRATLIGNLGADPEARNLPSGGQVVNIRLATTESWKDKQTGEKREKTEWHRVVVFNEGIGKVAMQYLKKGSKVMVEGQIQTRKWQDDKGVEKYSTEIVLNAFGATLILLGGNPEGGNGGKPEPVTKAQPAGGGGYGGGYGGGSADDDIPF